MVWNFFSLFAVLGLGWFVWQYRKEKRSLWVGISFLTAFSGLSLLIIFLLIPLESHPIFGRILLISAVIFLVFLLFFPFALIFSLIATGIQLIRREGLRLSHMLSFGLGIAYIVYLVIWPMFRDTANQMFFNFLYTFLSYVFFLTIVTLILYTITSLLNLIKVPGKKYSHIIVLGSGLLHGEKVTPLLASRVDKGIEMYHQNENSLLILSGGQGPDEKIPEAEAMKNYALSKNVPETDIMVEDQSKNTKENLQFSKKLIDHNRTDSSSILVVTTNYHVLRALLLGKQLGIDCDGRGSKTKFYFSLNAFIREWIAYLVMWKKMYFILMIIGLFFISLGYLLGL